MVANPPNWAYLSGMRTHWWICLGLLLAACGKKQGTANKPASPPPPVDLFAAEVAQAPAGYKANPLLKNIRCAEVNPGIFQRLAQSGANIRLNLVTQPAATAVFVAKQSQVEGELTFVGNLKNAPGAMIQLTKKDQQLSGRIALPGKPEVNIKHVAGAVHVIFELSAPNPAKLKGQ